MAVTSQRTGLRGKQRFWTPALEARATAMLEDGCSYSEVARTLGCCHQTVSARFPGKGWSRHDVGTWAYLFSPWRRPGGPIDYDLALRELQAGASYAHAARVSGCHYTTLVHKYPGYGRNQ